MEVFSNTLTELDYKKSCIRSCEQQKTLIILQTSAVSSLLTLHFFWKSVWWQKEAQETKQDKIMRTDL